MSSYRTEGRNCGKKPDNCLLSDCLSPSLYLRAEGRGGGGGEASCTIRETTFSLVREKDRELQEKGIRENGNYFFVTELLLFDATTSDQQQAEGRQNKKKGMVAPRNIYVDALSLRIALDIGRVGMP